MIVVGIDPHKRTHTAVAVELTTGELRGQLTVEATADGASELVSWAVGNGGQPLYAIEDCRHVSASLERFLLARGERVVRVPPKLMAGVRRRGRVRGKSDSVDALAVARAALCEPGLPPAVLDPDARDLRLLLAHREELIGERGRLQNRLRWHLHELELGADIPPGALDRLVWIKRVGGRLAHAEQTVQVALAREQLRRIEELTRRASELERQITLLVRERAGALLGLPGCGALTAAKLIAETAGASRFRTEAQLAMHAGIAPLDASSGQQTRHRLNRTGNRQLNCAIHRIAVTQGRCHRPAAAYLARKRLQGKTQREAVRCLKRHLVRTIYQTLRELERSSAP
jgi:transposase